jgi:hypothetical protein
MKSFLHLTKYQLKFHTSSQGQGWNFAELSFSQLANIPSVAPHYVFGLDLNQIIFFIIFQFVNLLAIFGFALCLTPKSGYQVPML